jgi:2,4-dienoyl-CoA reductase-like NADH-dependent reductase (Old Yellow Enzyme family)
MAAPTLDRTCHRRCSGNGHLGNVMLQDSSHQRTDDDGGSIVHRSRCLREVVPAMVSVGGSDRVAVHMGLSGAFNGRSDSHPGTRFDDVAEPLNRLRRAYLHMIEPRVKGNVLIAAGQGPMAAGWRRHMFTGKIIVAGGVEPDTAGAPVEHGDADLVACGRHAWLIRTCPRAEHEVCLSMRMIARPSTRAVLKATSTTRSIVSRRRRWREPGGSVSTTLEWRSR